jgi:hypothetical protein
MRSQDEDDFIQRITQETFDAVSSVSNAESNVVELSDFHLEKPESAEDKVEAVQGETRVSWASLANDIKSLFTPCEILFNNKILRVEFDRKKIDFPMDWSIFKNIKEDCENFASFSYYSLNENGDIDSIFEILKDENDLEIGWISEDGQVYFGMFKKNDALRLQKFRKLLRSHHLEQLKVKNLESAA